MDSPIGNQLVERQTADFAANGVESTDDYGFGRVVDNDFNTRSGLQCANVAPFAANDASLHFIVFDVEHTHRIFDGCFGSHALNGLNHNLFGLLIGIKLGLVHDFVDIAGSIQLSLVLQTLHQSAFRLLSTQSGKFFELLLLLLLHFLHFLLLKPQKFDFIVDAQLLLIHLLLPTPQFFLALVESNLTLFQSILILLNLLIALLHLFFKLTFLVEKLFFHFQELLFFQHLGLFIGGRHHLIVFSFNHIAENAISCCASNAECHTDCYNC